MNDPTSRKNTKATNTCEKKQNIIRPTLKTFELAVQRRGSNLRSKLAKLSGASQY